MARKFVKLLSIAALFTHAASAQIKFTQLPLTTAVDGPFASTTGDFNGDGQADLAVANVGNFTISIYLGKGDGTFSPSVSYSVPSNCGISTLVVGDVNGDHKLDLIAPCTFGSSVVVFPGEGTGAFGPAVVTSLSSPTLTGQFFEDTFSGFATGDFNGDGRTDAAIIVATNTNDPLATQLLILLGRSDGTFGVSGPIDVPSGTVAVSVAAADFNRDGRIDLAVLSEFPSSSLAELLVILSGDGQGGFSTSSSMSWTGAVANLIAADINGDGIPDLLSDGVTTENGDSFASSLTVMLGAGDGTFHQSFSATGSSFVGTFGLVDVQGTGKPSIVEAVWSSSSLSSGTIVLRPANGQGGFGAAVTLPYPAATLPTSITSADFNNDGRPDIIATGVSSSSAESLLSSLASQGSTQLTNFASIYALLSGGSIETLLNNTPLATQSFTNTNAATFLAGPVAADSIVTAFGTGLASATASATVTPLPTTLGNIGVTVQDSAGVSRPAPLFYVSPLQVNYAIPDGTAPGTATISINGNATPFSTTQEIQTVAPGLFVANGYAVGSAVTSSGSSTNLVAANSAGQIAPVAVSASSGSDLTVLVLYGTGFRNHANSVTVNFNATSVTPAYAGAQGTYVGEDQLNVAVPASLKGAGMVNVSLTADGQTSNIAKILVQ